MNVAKRMRYLQRKVLLGSCLWGLAFALQGTSAAPQAANHPQHKAKQLCFAPSGSPLLWTRERVRALYTDPLGQCHQDTDQRYALQQSFGPPSGLRALPGRVWVRMQGSEPWLQYAGTAASALAGLAFSWYTDQQFDTRSHYVPVWHDSMLPPKSPFALHNSSFYCPFHDLNREFASAAQSARKKKE